MTSSPIAASDTLRAKPDPFTEIRIVTLGATRGANFWSTRPVTRLDVTIGSFDNISTAECEGLTDRLLQAMPGLEEHRCSIGTRGGFVTRLNRGTYAPHVIEHVALELQAMIGHDVGYGRSRGGDAGGHYTVIFEHIHEATGLRAAALALDVVQHAFNGTLGGVDHMVTELKAIAATPDVPPVTPRIQCGISGGAFRSEFRKLVAEQLFKTGDLVVDVSPGFLLQAGLPYARSAVAVVLDTALTDVPHRYRDIDRAEQLMSVLVDGVARDGLVIAPARAWNVQDAARNNRCKVAVFSGENDVVWEDKKVAIAAAWVDAGEVVLEIRGRIANRISRDASVPAHVQAAFELLKQLQER